MSTTVREEDIIVVNGGELTTSITPEGIKTVPKTSTEVESSSSSKRRKSETATRTSASTYLNQYKGQSGASIVYSKLQEYGVKVVNGYSGGAVLPLLDQFHHEHPRHSQPGAPEPIRWITNSNESSAGHVAEGYAKSIPPGRGGGSNSSEDDGLPVGVAIATSGPGVTNLITPLQDAICDGVPIIVLCGQAATNAPDAAFQSAPAVELTKPCTKWSYQIKSAAEVPMALDYAFYIARHGRPGPVFLDLPKDLQIEVVTDELIEKFVNNLPSGSTDDYEEDEHQPVLAKLVSRRRKGDGEDFTAIHLGHSSQGLVFEFANNDKNKNNKSAELKLRPVKDAALPTSSSSSQEYHADHHPSNKIYKKTTAVERINGDTQETSITRTQIGKLGGETVMQDMMDMIRMAKKPVIIAGQGCNDCSDELKQFAETLQIPVTTTLHALGCFDERHDLALNMLGMHGHPTPNYMVQDADLIICIGSRFDDRITGRASDFIPEARRAAVEGRGGVIHVDIRLTQKAKQVDPTYFVHSTGKTFLRAVNQELASMDSSSIVPNTKEWLERKKTLQQEFPITIPHFPKETITIKSPDGKGDDIETVRTRMSAQSVISELNRQILAADKMDDCIFSTGVGIHQMVAAQLITWTKPRQMLSSGSLGTMGVALGYAIGAKLANGKKIVIAVDGDGSFNMTFTELKSVAEQGIPIKILLLDNESQMMVEYWQKLFNDGRYLAVRNPNNPDYTKLADAFGIKSLYCDCEENLEEKMKEFLFEDSDKPVLFHVRIERTPCLPLVAPGQPLHEMILEDKEYKMDAASAPS